VPEHLAARRFLDELAGSDSVVVCERVLIQLYGLLRNPAVFPNPASPAQAVVRVDALRRHPRWRLVDDPGDVPTFMDRLWAQAAAS
jgi:predicted nucleic acid-binding protein